MKMSPATRLKAALSHRLLTLGVFCLLLAGGWLSTRHPLRLDITANASNTLSSATQKLLAAMPDSIKVTAYIKKGVPLRLQIMQLLDRYRSHKADMTLVFVDPDSQPDITRDLEIGPEGAVLVEYRGHTEKLTFVDESTLTNALLQLAHSQQRWVSFLTGHGERAPDSIANFGWGQFGKALARRNISTVTLNLATLANIPDNSALLVIAAPTVPLLAGEIGIIKHYIDQGGNLLLLEEPDSQPLTVLQEQLGIHPVSGAIIDTSTRIYGIDDPSFVIANHYPAHPITHGLQLISLYPGATALSVSPNSKFRAQPLLESAGQSAIGGDRNAHSQVFAYALTRELSNQQQRLVVVGDSDFLANTYLGNVGNLDVGMRIINWLLHNDGFIDIPSKSATDKQLQLSTLMVGIMGFGFLLGLPFVLFGTGLIVWRKRKQG